MPRMFLNNKIRKTTTNLTKVATLNTLRPFLTPARVLNLYFATYSQGILHHFEENINFLNIHLPTLSFIGL